MKYLQTRYIWIFLCLLLAGETMAVRTGRQGREPSGKILSDTIETGKVFSYSLSYRHNSDFEVFFPDSTYDFSPFRLVNQQFFTTFTEGQVSLDSTVYKLISYEVAPKLGLSLPIFLLTGRDCTTVYAPGDTVFVKLSVPRDDPEKLRMESDNRVIPSGLDFNYSVVLLILAATGVFAFSIYWFFGDTLSQQWRLFQLQRRHRDFLRIFQKLHPGAEHQPNLSNVENAVILWKKYLEKILKRPFATYTTREILDHFESDSLAGALKEIDRAIYGQIRSAKIVEAMEVLRNVAQNVYRNKRKEIADKTESAPDFSPHYPKTQLPG